MVEISPPLPNQVMIPSPPKKIPSRQPRLRIGIASQKEGGGSALGLSFLTRGADQRLSDRPKSTLAGLMKKGVKHQGPRHTLPASSCLSGGGVPSLPIPYLPSFPCSPRQGQDGAKKLLLTLPHNNYYPGAGFYFRLFLLSN